MYLFQLVPQAAGEPPLPSRLVDVAQPGMQQVLTRVKRRYRDREGGQPPSFSRGSSRGASGRRREAWVREGKEVGLRAGIHRSAFGVPRVAGGERTRRMREGSGSTDLQCDRQCLVARLTKGCESSRRGRQGRQGRRGEGKSDSTKKLGAHRRGQRLGCGVQALCCSACQSRGYYAARERRAHALVRQGAGLRPAQMQLALSTTAAARGCCNPLPCLCGKAWAAGWRLGHCPRLKLLAQQLSQPTGPSLWAERCWLRCRPAPTAAPASPGRAALA